ncbi:SMI1/KNR4 family protein (plasmid) [Bacillus cereus]|uniref:Knr4/Smi1-like domain-containing protein n=1 Tax=Bacillus thuringiensis serovar kumamotoensis TaxID=132267 RepID=A0A9X6PRG2_BACUK|nr:SMI1/KNR4 family protein [Bacillus thuringiensis]MDA2252439.1 SMI1/KNR4 family protein [Bacillus cereus]MDA2280229.1 SMI1/KNR4 family protein [Bacillus cereus]MDA2693875.1 SMI1/KNR4 family protein [Bacillus cereus]MDA2699519.1 SMI1/KNR4 family protein [Bacillus cereus]MDA2721848.1 SMI1/KNR4 family protein [Bacillus cereus]
MLNSQNWINNWNETFHQIEKIKGDIESFVVEKSATEEEIKLTEQQLGYPLPISFKEVLVKFSKQVELRWSFPDELSIPAEFDDIFAGELCWNLDSIEDLAEVADSLKDVGDNYGENLRQKLAFYTVPNGDYLALDLNSNNEDAAVVYWDHEEDSVTYVADNFIEFIEKFTDLNLIGAEIWQWETFIDSKGINTDSEIAQKWKKLFTEL